MSGNLLVQHVKKLRADYPHAAKLLQFANGSSQGSGTIESNAAGCLYSVILSNDTFIECIRFRPTGTAPAGLSTTVARIFLSTNYNNGGASITSSAETHLFAEVVLNFANVSSATDANNCIDVPMGFRLPALWNVLVGISSAPGGTGIAWQAEAITSAADYL